MSTTSKPAKNLIGNGTIMKDSCGKEFIITSIKPLTIENLSSSEFMTQLFEWLEENKETKKTVSPQ